MLITFLHWNCWKSNKDISWNFNTRNTNFFSFSKISFVKVKTPI